MAAQGFEDRFQLGLTETQLIAHIDGVRSQPAPPHSHTSADPRLGGQLPHTHLRHAAVLHQRHSVIGAGAEFLPKPFREPVMVGSTRAPAAAPHAARLALHANCLFLGADGIQPPSRACRCALASAAELHGGWLGAPGTLTCTMMRCSVNHFASILLAEIHACPCRPRKSSKSTRAPSTTAAATPPWRWTSAPSWVCVLDGMCRDYSQLRVVLLRRADLWG